MTLDERQRELDNCSFCKAMLMLLIVMYHVILPWAGWKWSNIEVIIEAPVLKYLAMWLNSFHIYGFALISGYIYAFSKLEKDKYKKFGELIKVKAKRLLVPYLFFSVLWAVPTDVIVQKYGFKEFFRAYILATQPRQLWFLIMLFGVFAVFYLLTDFFAEHDIKGLIAALAFYGVGTICNRYIEDYFQIWNICRYILFFWLGFKIRQRGSDWLYKIPVVIYVAADIALFALNWLLPNEHFIWQAIKPVVSMLLYVVGAVTAFVVFQRLAKRTSWKENKLLSKLVILSMPIYLLHQQISYFLTIKLNGVISPYLQVAINFGFTIIVSMAIAAFLYRFKPTRIMMGEKA